MNESPPWGDVAYAEVKWRSLSCQVVISSNVRVNTQAPTSTYLIYASLGTTVGNHHYVIFCVRIGWYLVRERLCAGCIEEDAVWVGS